MSDSAQTERCLQASDEKRYAPDTDPDYSPSGPSSANRSALLRCLRAFAPLLVVTLILAGCSSDNEASPVGAVEVTVQDLEGLEGGQVAGVLYQGEGLEMPDTRVIGGFGVSIDADPFSTTEWVRVGQDSTSESSGLFPYVTDDILSVEPGSYTLMLWAADSAIGPYSRWVPGGPDSLIGCSTIFEAEEGQSASVTIVGGLDEVSTGTPTCTIT